MSTPRSCQATLVHHLATQNYKVFAKQRACSGILPLHCGQKIYHWVLSIASNSESRVRPEQLGAAMIATRKGTLKPSNRLPTATMTLAT